MRKRDLFLPVRTPRYVSREVGAAELCISPDTWDDWVERGLLPKPRRCGPSGFTVRWKWDEVEAAMDAVAEDRQQSEPVSDFAERFRHAAKKDKRRGAA